MGEILGLGMTHAPMFQFPDENMADILRRFLTREDIPAERRNIRNWPAAMREEWGDDEGLSAARRHREAVVASFRRMRAEVEAFDPDFILVWGDDQYENFREDIVPPFCVYIYDQLDCLPYANSPAVGASRNIWGVAPDEAVAVKGHREAASHLTRELLRDDFDIAFALRPHHHPTLAHAFMRTLVYLDYDRKGFSWPLIPFHVNCYGSDMLEQVAGGSRIDGFPPAPNPRRCYDLGKSVAEIIERSDYRAVVIGSSSWSHAFLTRKHYGLYPDIEADRLRFRELRAGRQHEWRDLSLETLMASGQHEMLNWLCLAGAMEGRTPDYAEMVETHIFNSTKVSAIFRPQVPGQAAAL